MRSVPLAMTWEMLAHRPWNLLAGALGANLLPVLILVALRHEGGSIPADASVITLHVVLVQMQMFAFGVAVFSSQGSPARLYAWPVRTATIVAWHLIPAMIITATVSLISTLVLNSLFQLGWPLWGPAMFVAMGVAAIQAVSWMTEKSGWIVAGLSLVAGPLSIWFKSRYGAPFAQPDHYWLRVEPSEVATMFGIAMLAYAAAIVAVARNRRSEPPLSMGIIAWLRSIPEPFPKVGHSFRTAGQAQTWFEWRQKGWMMPTTVVCSLGLGGCCWLLFSRDPERLFDAMIAAGAMLSVLGVICGLAMGICGNNDGNLEIGPFLATRPMTTPEVARTLLKVLAQSVFVAWFLWALPFVLLYLVLLANEVILRPELSTSLKLWYLPATLASAWMVAAVLAAIGLTGRSGLLMKLLVGLILSWIGLLLLFKFGLSDQAQVQFSHGAATVCGVAFLLITAWLFVAAHRRLLIGWSTVYVAGCSLGVLSLLVAIAWRQQTGVSLSALVLLVGLAALAVAPLAAAPLALTWNRNR